MAYANRKGYEGEKETEAFLNSFLSPLGFKFMRVGGTERNKRVFAGDVVLNPRATSSKTPCVLSDYFLEVKKRGTIDIWGTTDKAREDAEWWGKRGYILFATLQRKGEVGKGGKKLVVMDQSTFERLVRELQGFLNEQSH